MKLLAGRHSRENPCFRREGCNIILDTRKRFSSARAGYNLAKAAAHDSLGSVLRLRGDLPGAIDAYRKAILVDPDDLPEARYNLGVALAESGDVSGAIVALRQAIQHEVFHWAGSSRLVRTILIAQRPGEAIGVLRRVREEAHSDETIAEAIDRAIGQFEHLSKLGVPIPRIFRFSYRGDSLAGRYYDIRLFAASATIWSAGFATDPKLSEDMKAQNRYNAACSAALASAGKGIDKPPLDEPAKARWRIQALDWLKADLAHWTKEADSGATDAKALVRKTLQHWKADRDLASVRYEADLKKLSEAERDAWQAFWAEVAALLKTTEKS